MDVSPVVAPIVTWIFGSLIVPAAVSFLAFLILLPTKFGQKTLDHHFATKFAGIQKEHAREIEKLKQQLAHLGDRGKHSNEREYAALTAIWEKFVDAYLLTHACGTALRQHPDLSRMHDDAVSSFLETTEFSQSEIQSILRSTDKNAAYGRLMDIANINKLGVAIWESRLILRKQGIFTPAELNDKFSDALTVLGSVQIETMMEIQHPSSRKFDKRMEFTEKGEKMFKEIADLTRDRLLRQPE